MSIGRDVTLRLRIGELSTNLACTTEYPPEVVEHIIKSLGITLSTSCVGYDIPVKDGIKIMRLFAARAELAYLEGKNDNTV